MKCSFLAITICLASLATINTVRAQENTCDLTRVLWTQP